MGRGREATGNVGGGGGARPPEARQRQRLERLDKVVRAFLVRFVLPASHGGDFGLCGVSVSGGNNAGGHLNGGTTSASRTKGRGDKKGGVMGSEPRALRSDIIGREPQHASAGHHLEAPR